MSLVILEDPINFGNKDNDPVKAVFGLCSTDNHLHIKALSDLGKFANVEENFNKLISLDDPELICDYIEKVCKESENV